MCTVNTIQVLLLAALGVSLVATFVMRMPSASRSRARKLLAQAEWLDDDAADGTYVKVRGVVATRAHGERFLSPLTKNRCVVMRLRAAVRRGRDPRSKLVVDLKIMPFVIEDANVLHHGRPEQLDSFLGTHRAMNAGGKDDRDIARRHAEVGQSLQQQLDDLRAARGARGVGDDDQDRVIGGDPLLERRRLDRRIESGVDLRIRQRRAHRIVRREEREPRRIE